MRNHLVSIGIGLAMAVVGVLLWVTASDVETPIITLSKGGLVLVLGVMEVAISGSALARPSTRHTDSPV